MEIYKVKNYKVFAEELKEKTGCSVLIKVMGTNHTHYQISMDGVSIGVLCIDNGEVSFAPFVTLDNAENNQFIDAHFMPSFRELSKVLSVLEDMFVEE